MPCLNPLMVSPCPSLSSKSHGTGSPNPTANLSGPIDPYGLHSLGIETKVFPLR